MISTSDAIVNMGTCDLVLQTRGPYEPKKVLELYVDQRYGMLNGTKISS